MSDGRTFTDYSTACFTGMSSNDVRRYYSQNAAALMEKNSALAFRSLCDSSCYSTGESGTMLPEVQYMECDTRACRVVPGAPFGLGMGRGATKGP